MCNKLLTKNNNKIDITVVHGLVRCDTCSLYGISHHHQKISLDLFMAFHTTIKKYQRYILTVQQVH